MIKVLLLGIFIGATIGYITAALMAAPNYSEIPTSSTAKDDLAVDYISRIETIDYLCKHCPDDGECFKDCDDIKHFREMSSVTPIRSKGHWIDKERIMFPICSKCGLTSVEKYSFCPNCGAKMESEENGNVNRPINNANCNDDEFV